MNRNFLPKRRQKSSSFIRIELFNFSCCVSPCPHIFLKFILHCIMHILSFCLIDEQQLSLKNWIILLFLLCLARAPTNLSPIHQRGAQAEKQTTVGGATFLKSSLSLRRKIQSRKVRGVMVLVGGGYLSRRRVDRGFEGEGGRGVFLILNCWPCAWRCLSFW